MKHSWTFNSLYRATDTARAAARVASAALVVAALLIAGSALAGAGGASGLFAVQTARAAVLADVSAAAPPLISYQGRLVDPATGLPKPDGAYTMSFRLYTVDAGGVALYTETRPVNVLRATFSVLLGEVTPLDTNVFNGQALYLGVTVGADPEMTPRLRLAHAPYAIFANRAANADSAATVADNAITAPKIADGSVGAAEIGANAVDGARVGDNTLTGADIADGSLGLADLAGAAQPDRFITPNIYGAFISGAAAFSDGFGPNAGLLLQEAASTGSFAVNFTLPPSFPAGGSLSGRLVYNINQTGCAVFLAPNFISVARVGRNHIVGGGATTGLSMSGSVWTVAGTANQSSALAFTVTTPQPATPLQPLDTITIGFYRSPANGSDTCTQSVVVQGISMTY